MPERESTTTDTDPPPTPPEGALLRRYREAQHLSIKRAAERAEISKGRWIDIERGYSTPTRGVKVKTSAGPETLARMALALSISAQELDEVDRADAAEIMETWAGHALPDPVVEAIRDSWRLTDEHRDLVLSVYWTLARTRPPTDEGNGADEVETAGQRPPRSPSTI